MSFFKGLGLVILCSRENEDSSYLVASLKEYKIEGIPRLPQPEEIKCYLRSQFKAPQQNEVIHSCQPILWRAAAEVERAKK